MMSLRELLEKSANADVLRGMIGFAAERMMELEVGALTGAAYGEKSGERLAQRNGYRDRGCQTRAGTVELRIPKLRNGAVAARDRDGQLERLPAVAQVGEVCENGLQAWPAFVVEGEQHGPRAIDPDGRRDRQRAQRRRALFADIEDYDDRRRVHSALGCRSPEQA